jgi:tRNA 2-thiouridine synthesizing protein C
MSVPGKKRIAVVCRHSPYGGSYPREALDTALAAAAFDQPVTLVFMGDGVWQLLPEQRPDSGKSLEKQLGALPLYDIDTLYVEAESLAQRGLDAAELALPVQVLSSTALADLLAGQDVVLGF